MVPSFALGILAIACCSFCGGEYNHHLGAAPATRTETIDSIDMEFPEPQSPEGPCHSSSSPMSRFRSGMVMNAAEDEDTYRCGAGQWCSEPVLWTTWEYQGSLCSDSAGSFLALADQDFIAVVKKHQRALVDVLEYGKLYVKAMNSSFAVLSDLQAPSSQQVAQEEDWRQRLLVSTRRILTSMNVGALVTLAATVHTSICSVLGADLAHPRSCIVTTIGQTQHLCRWSSSI